MLSLKLRLNNFDFIIIEKHLTSKIERSFLKLFTPYNIFIPLSVHTILKTTISSIINYSHTRAMWNLLVFRMLLNMTCWWEENIAVRSWNLINIWFRIHAFVKVLNKMRDPNCQIIVAAEIVFICLNLHKVNFILIHSIVALKCDPSITFHYCSRIFII